MSQKAVDLEQMRRETERLQAETSLALARDQWYRLKRNPALRTVGRSEISTDGAGLAVFRRGPGHAAVHRGVPRLLDLDQVLTLTAA